MKRILIAKMTHRRRAATAVSVLVTLPAVVGFAALTIDVAVLHGTPADLQNAAETATRAAASELASDTTMQVRMGVEYTDTTSMLQVSAVEKASDVSALNQSFGRTHTAIEFDDVAMGSINLDSAGEPLRTGVSGLEGPRMWNRKRATRIVGCGFSPSVAVVVVSGQADLPRAPAVRWGASCRCDE